jgi:hypothetical protein
MAKNVKLTSLTDVELGFKGLVIKVQDGDDILGHMMIGKASIVWFEKNAKKKGYKANWEELIEFMNTRKMQTATRPD